MAIINEFTNNSRNQPQYFGCLKDISSESKVTLVDGTMQLFNYLTGNYYLMSDTSSDSEISTKFEDYYTQAQVNGLTTTLSNKFNNYHTKDAVNRLTTTLSNKFDNYHTKDAVNGLTTTLSNKFEDYYTSAQVNELLEELSNKIIIVINSKHPTT